MFNVFADKIFYFDKVIPNPEEIIDLIEKTNDALSDNDLISSWHKWESSSGDYVFGYRKMSNPDAYDDADDDVKHIYDTLMVAQNLVGSKYAEELSIPTGTHAPISISKYEPNAYMGPHADEGPMAHISAVIYLNDNFDDGGLYFPNQDIFIKPAAGSVIVFPSVEPYIHDPKPASKVKYISPAFWFIENTPLRNL